MSQTSYTTQKLGIRPQDYLGPALLQARCRKWQQELSPELLGEIRLHLLHVVPSEVLNPLAEPVSREQAIRRAIRDWLERYHVGLFSQGGESLVAYLYGEVAGFGPLQPFLADPEVTEIKLVDPQTVLLERAGQRLCRPVDFPGGVEEVRRLAIRLAELGGKAASRREPVSQVQLSDGSRILLMPFEKIPQVFIRRRAPRAFDMETLIAYGTLDEPIAAYLRALARARAFFLVAGPSGAGKTAFLEALLALFPVNAHIVVVQQGTEIRKEGVHPLITLIEGSDDPGSPNSLEAVAMRTLKMGMISLVIGETKGAEATAILHSISAGIKGGGTTIHTDDSEEALRRLARLARSSRFTDLYAAATPEELRQSVARSVHVVVQLEQAPQTGRRYVRQVDEVEVVAEGWALRPIFRGRMQPGIEEMVGWERLAESGPRVQSLLAAYADGQEEGESARLEMERRASVERLLSSAAVLARSADWDEAESALEQVLALAPDDSSAQALLERVRAGQQEKCRLRQAEEFRIRAKADMARAEGRLGLLEQLAVQAGLAHLDDLAQELSDLLWREREGTLPVDELFALALERLGEDPLRARRLLQVVLRRQPDHPEAAFYLGLISSPEGGE